MLSNAIALAILTTAGAMIVYSKLPRKVRRFLEKHSLMTDLTALFAVYYLLGGTLTALVAGALCGLFVSILLYIQQNQQDFLALYDLRDFIRQKLKEAKEAANAFGKVYREKKENESIPLEVVK